MKPANANRLYFMSILSICAAAGCNTGDKAKGDERVSAESAPKSTAEAAKPPVKMPLSPGRTPPPSLEEWNSMRKEVTVKGSSALNCETKIVREYLRVSCRGKNDTGGTPTTVGVTRGGREAYTFAAGGVTSLVVPFVSGVHLEAMFSWTDKAHKLVVKWPNGAPQPPIVGVFEGASSPLDARSPDIAERLCTCHKKITGSQSCEDVFGGADPDCDRTYANDCANLLACSRFEPGVWPKCQEGFVNGPPMGRCVQKCGAGNTCPSGKVCATDMGTTPVCVEP